MGMPECNDRGLEGLRVSHDEFMLQALDQARLGLEAGEVPVGAIVTIGGRVVGRGFNQPIRATDPTAHAEVVAMREAAREVGNYRLVGATLYVTLEPCLMCVGAMVHARIGTLVYGAPEPKTGAIVSTCQAHENAHLNHRFDIVPGVLGESCRAIVQEFFRLRRAKPAERAAAVAEDGTTDAPAEGADDGAMEDDASKV
jgi:tRNA(adenine34) deaminase